MLTNFSSILFDRINSFGSSIAILETNRLTTFNQLDSQSSLAKQFLEKYVTKGCPVGFLGAPSIEFITYLLGALKLGGIYVPIPLDQTKNNQLRILHEIPGLIVISFNQDSLAEELGVFLYFSVSRSKWIYNYNLKINPNLFPEETLYIAFSSGSINTPKGVLGSQTGLLNRLLWLEKTYPFLENEILCQKTSLSFVDHIAEIFQPLFSGQPLRIINHRDLKDVHLFSQTLFEQKITRLTIVPSYLTLLLEIAKEKKQLFSYLKFIFSSGEPLLQKLCKELKNNLDHIRIVNIYGSSEVSADVSFHEYSEDLTSTTQSISISKSNNLSKSQFIPIGVPISNCEIKLLNSNNETCVEGEEGEIIVIGQPLFLGYLHEFKFIQSYCRPILFKTGDLGKMNAEGLLEYIGRKDRSVKINGIQLHLTEFEGFLKEALNLKECALLVSKIMNITQLILFYESFHLDKKVSTIDVSEIKKLNLKVFPSKIIELERIPRLPSGKVDYRKLENLTVKQKNKNEDQITENSFEEAYYKIYSEFLPINLITKSSNFFDLGFDSITINHLLIAINKKFNLNLALIDLFEHPTPSQLLIYLMKIRDKEFDYSPGSKRQAYFTYRRKLF